MWLLLLLLLLLPADNDDVDEDDDEEEEEECKCKYEIQVLDALLIELNELLEKANAANSNWKGMWQQSSVCILKLPFAKVCQFIESPKTH